MSNQTAQDPFLSIAATDLHDVIGGAARVTARTGAANDQLLQMLTQISDSIKQLATSSSTKSDPMSMMMPMMMMMKH